MGEVQRPKRIRRFMALVSMDLAASFKAKPCRRDLMDMYVSKGACDVLPVKPAALAAALMSWTEASSYAKYVSRGSRT